MDKIAQRKVNLCSFHFSPREQWSDLEYWPWLEHYRWALKEKNFEKNFQSRIKTIRKVKRDSEKKLNFPNWKNSWKPFRRTSKLKIFFERQKRIFLLDFFYLTFETAMESPDLYNLKLLFRYLSDQSSAFAHFQMSTLAQHDSPALIFEFRL